jgi:glycosyltransferase involved in cell wall biosynthesis
MSERTPRLLRVGLDGRALQPDGPQAADPEVSAAARELLRALAQRNDLVITLWVDAARAVPEGVVPPGVRLQRYPAPVLPLADGLTVHPALAWLGAKRKHDVFHWFAHGHAPAYLPAGGSLAVRDLFAETHTELHADGASRAFRAARRHEAKSLRGAAVVLATSAALREELIARHELEPERVCVVPPGVSARFAPVSPAEVAGLRKHHGLDVPFVLYRAGHDRRMDTSLLLHAFARLRKKRKDRVLLVCEGALTGSPEHAAFVALMEELRLGKVVRFLGEVPSEHHARLIAAARVVALPARADGTGQAALEAMACGTPVVCTAVGALAEVSADAALAVPPGDVKAFAQQLARGIDDEELHARLREDGRRRAAAHTWARAADESVAAWRAMLASTSA